MNNHRKLQELTVSKIAVVTYLGDFDDATDYSYAKVFLEALKKGINFFDTAINYRCGRSEMVLGEVLKKENRQDIVVATKGGFIPFEKKPPSDIKKYIHKKFIQTKIISPDDIVGGSHCLHPNFLSHQIEQSLDHLKMDQIDIYYLHNPETELPFVGEKVLYEKLRNAFILLEEKVQEGKISYYGLATWNGFQVLSLEKIMNLADEVGGSKHHLKVIQLPYNLAMLEAVAVHNQHYQGKSYPIFSVADFYGLSVCVSAPLLQGQILQLSESVMKKIPGKLTNPQKALQFVVSTPCVTAAMVGMKNRAHLDENSKILALPNWDLATLKNICEQLG